MSWQQLLGQVLPGCVMRPCCPSWLSPNPSNHPNLHIPLRLPQLLATDNRHHIAAAAVQRTVAVLEGTPQGPCGK